MFSRARNPPFPAPMAGSAADGRTKKDISQWTTMAVNDLATSWKDTVEKDADDISYESHKILDWGWGIGPRDAMRAGWRKDVGDLEFITDSYKDPSSEMFSWWYASVAAQMREKMKITEKWAMAKIFLVLLCSKFLSTATKIVDYKTLQIFGCFLLAKIAMSLTKSTSIGGKILSRMTKIEYCLNISTGNNNSLMFYQGQKLAKIEERIQDQASSPNDCGRKMTQYMYESLKEDRNVDYMLTGIERIKEIYFSARMQCKDINVQFMQKGWFKVFDHSLEILVGKMQSDRTMTPAHHQKIQEVQQREAGVSLMAIERFGTEAGRTDVACDRTWIQ